MSQQLRQLKGRIRSIEGTWKVTRAMEMVALSKFKALEMPLARTRAYDEKLSSVARDLIGTSEELLKHPFVAPRKNGGAVGLFIVSSDAGLCGVYNEQLFKIIDRFREDRSDREFEVFVFGRKAATYCRKRGMAPVESFPTIHGRLKPDFHKRIYEVLAERFSRGGMAEFHVAYTIFENALKHHPVVEKLLPVEVHPEKSAEFIVESGPRAGLAPVIPMFVASRLRRMMMEAFTSEHSARMVAMKAAKDNAKELMGDLILLRNKLRQALITREVIEIISSAEALKG